MNITQQRQKFHDFSIYLKAKYRYVSTLNGRNSYQNLYTKEISTEDDIFKHWDSENESRFADLLSEQIDKLPYQKHADDGGYNDGQITGFEQGTEWLRGLIKEIAYGHGSASEKMLEIKILLG
jgi:hypothetical protein